MDKQAILVNAVMAWLRNQDLETQRIIWNEYHGGDEYVYWNVDDVAQRGSDDPTEMMRAVYFGNIGNWDDYVYFNAYGNLESWYGIDEGMLIYVAEWAVEHDLAKFSFTVGDGVHEDTYDAASIEEAEEFFAEDFYGIPAEMVDKKAYTIAAQCTAVEV